MAKRHYSATANDVTYELSLIFDINGGARMVRGSPAMQPLEREMRIRVTLPKAIFRTPSLNATIKINDTGGHAKAVAEIEQTAQKALRNSLTGDFRLTVVPIEGVSRPQTKAA